MLIVRNDVFQLNERNVLLYCVISEGWRFVIENFWVQIIVY